MEFRKGLKEEIEKAFKIHFSYSKDFEILYHFVMDHNKYGLTKNEADTQDMADEYVIVRWDSAVANIIVLSRYRDFWGPNPYFMRWVVRELISLIPGNSFDAEKVINEPCCNVFEKIMSDFSWMHFYDEKSANKLLVIPYIQGELEKDKYRVNYCPSCGKYIRNIQLDINKMH